MNQLARINELKETSKLAALNNDFEMLEQLFLEIKELEGIIEPDQFPVDNVEILENDYTRNTPVSVIVSNRISQLIGCYSRKSIKAAYYKHSFSDSMIEVHLTNLILTYGPETVKEIMRMFFSAKKVKNV